MHRMHRISPYLDRYIRIVAAKSEEFASLVRKCINKKCRQFASRESLCTKIYYEHMLVIYLMK